MSAVGNLTLNKPLCVHFSSVLRCPMSVCCVSRQVIQGCMHDYLPFKPQNKLLFMPTGNLHTLALPEETSDDR